MIFDDNTIEQITQHVDNQLRAHDADLEEELSNSEDGQVQITFNIQVNQIVKGKFRAKIKTRIPRAATVTETLLADWQMKLPGM